VAPRRWGLSLRRGVVAPPKYEGLGPGYAPQNFSKINVKIAYFSAFLEAEMVSSAVASR